MKNINPNLKERYERFCTKAKDLLEREGLAIENHEPQSIGRGFYDEAISLAQMFFPKDKKLGKGPVGLLWGTGTQFRLGRPEPDAGLRVARMLKTIIEERPNPDEPIVRGVNTSGNRGINTLSCDPIFGRAEEPPAKVDVFVLMPFEEKLKAVYDDHIKKVLTNLDLAVVRADDLFSVSSIISDIWNAISASRFLVADCTGRNANVFYELGIAHTLGKPVIIISQSDKDIPFDIQHIRVIIYEYTPRGIKSFETKLERTVNSVLQDLNSLGKASPVGDRKQATDTSSREKSEAAGELFDRIQVKRSMDKRTQCH